VHAHCFLRGEFKRNSENFFVVCGEFWVCTGFLRRDNLEGRELRVERIPRPICVRYVGHWVLDLGLGRGRINPWS
jgi:hypothetical protein